MTRQIDFFVQGIPVPQGSKRAFVVRGKPILTEEAGVRHKTWRHDIRSKGEDIWNAAPADGPVTVRLIFRFPRPLSHYGTGGNRNVMKATAPMRHTQKPDIDKLSRAVLDALTGVVWVDDDQIDLLVASKVWATTDEAMPLPGVEVYVDVR